MKKSYIIAAIVILLILAGALLFMRGDEDTWICSNDQWVKHGNPSAAQPTQGCGTTDKNTNAGLANPASVFCKDQGGELRIRTDENGGQIGICIFTDGSECEEWAYFRGECQKSQSLKKEVTCVEAPCGPLPTGQNSCLTDPPKETVYQGCTTDTDCPDGKTCQEVECWSGDTGVNYNVCK